MNDFTYLAAAITEKTVTFQISAVVGGGNQ
jgi:hypothetical protein